ncbi:MAG: element excision factor XisI family protein [Cyanobacteria bacterium J06592_8]
MNGCAIHVDIIDGKIWVQHDGTKDAIAFLLTTSNVAKINQSLVSSN